MGAGTAIGSFLAGAMQGYQFGDGIEERKRQRARDDKRETWAEEDRVTAAEDRRREIVNDTEDRAWKRELMGFQRNENTHASAMNKLSLSQAMQADKDRKDERAMWASLGKNPLATAAGVDGATGEKAGAAFADYYAGEQVPKITEFYLSRGEPEKAAAFQQWADSQEVRKMTKAYGQALQAASIGNDAGFIDGMVRVYDSVDDGVSVVREKSSLIRDENGAITGATVTFKDDSGKTWTKDYSGQADIVESFLTQMAPHNQFEWQIGQIGGASEAAAKQAEREHKITLEMVKAQLKGDKGMAADVLKQVNSMRDTQAEMTMYGGQTEKLSDAELVDRAIAIVKQARSGEQSTAGQEPAPYIRN